MVHCLLSPLLGSTCHIISTTLLDQQHVNHRLEVIRCVVPCSLLCFIYAVLPRHGSPYLTPLHNVSLLLPTPQMVSI